ncbi:MAG: MgtC/SapB family protein [Clostridia bacterium]|nr:MgtC/SapB family protein [Clostridia bacterium]
MIRALDFLRNTDTLSTIVKLVLSLVLGGIIGIEREIKHRPAGFRTHILISLGSAITTMTSIYMFVNLHLYTDISRLGASVIAGMGFVGAGAIIVTKNRKVKGLTTAAGFWVTAIIGLSVGAGYYEGAIAGTILVVLAEVLFSKIEYGMLNSKRNIVINVTYDKPECLSNLLSLLRERGVRIAEIEVTKNKKHENDNLLNASLDLQLRKNADVEKLITELKNISGVVAISDELYTELKK